MSLLIDCWCSFKYLLATSTELFTTSFIFLSNHFSILKLNINKEKIATTIEGIAARQIKYNKSLFLVLLPISNLFFFF